MSKIGGGDVALPSELEGWDGGRRLSSTEVRLLKERGGDEGSEPKRKSSPLFELVELKFRWCIERDSSICLREGDHPPLLGEETDVGMNCSCSFFDAFRNPTIFPISVTVVATWLAAASKRLTGDSPALVA